MGLRRSSRDGGSLRHADAQARRLGVATPLAEIAAKARRTPILRKLDVATRYQAAEIAERYLVD